MTLTTGEIRALRARAHALSPVVMIGEAGLTPTVIREIERALVSHELIKIRMLGDDRAARNTMTDIICEATQAKLVQRVGKIIVCYRLRPEGEAAQPARKPRKPRKPVHRTKRSFQM